MKVLHVVFAAACAMHQEVALAIVHVVHAMHETCGSASHE